MRWVVEVLTSEFLWGLVIGLFLALVVAYLSIQLQVRQRRNAALQLCTDLIVSICELIQNIEDHRHPESVINSEFLGTIDAELHVYGRNREHLVLVSDAKLRSDIRRFFTRVAALVAEMRGHLSQYDEAYLLGQSGLAHSHLVNLHQACDQLSEVKDCGSRITSRSKST